MDRQLDGWPDDQVMFCLALITEGEGDVRPSSIR